MRLWKKTGLFMLVVAAFALMWSFMMPTISVIVTPVSQPLPAFPAQVSVKTPADTHHHTPQKALDSLTDVYPSAALLYLYLCLIIRRTKRDTWPAPHWRRRRLLTTIQFSSRYT